VISEATMIVDDTRPPISDTYAAQLSNLIENDDRNGAIKLFMREGVGVPAVGVFFMQMMPAWKQMREVAHTVPYDTAIVEVNQKGNPLVSADWQSVTAPTMVIVGGKSPAWMQNGMRMLADVLPNVQHQTLNGQTHIVDAKALAPSIIAFLKD
jgi:pimeloyl-ACP methyl ester carboxylesterase